ncbi:MAG: hypothetical protein AAB486_04355 [Patescibacteria group bacterium]
MLTTKQLRKIAWGGLAVLLIFNAIFHVLAFEQMEVVGAAVCLALYATE